MYGDLTNGKEFEEFLVNLRDIFNQKKIKIT